MVSGFSNANLRRNSEVKLYFLPFLFIALNFFDSAFALPSNSCSTVFAALSQTQSSSSTEISSPIGSLDVYRNFAELAASETYGKDYSLVVQDRQSPVTVLAIHAGKIEYGTEKIARLIAGDTHNLFVFRAMTSNMQLDPNTGAIKKIPLHLTSRHFDEPHAVQLASGAQTAISIHGFKAKDICWICMGGTNEALAEKIKMRLKLLGRSHWRTTYPCKLFPAKDADNIVNRPAQGGVQLELSRGLRDELEERPEDLALFVRIIKEALSE